MFLWVTYLSYAFELFVGIRQFVLRCAQLAVAMFYDFFYLVTYK